ncbi:MAG TPA: sulfatase [bacterium]|nr:sulfatase [bacterium]
MTARPSRRLLSFGLLAGAALGAAAGLVEAVARPLGEPLRAVYALGADGLLGAAWGLAAAALRRFRPGDDSGARADVLAVTIFPGLAIGLGLFANRVVLTGANFLSPVSLFADVVAVAAASGLALGVRRVAGRGLSRSPRGGALPSFVVIGLLAAAFLVPPRLLSGVPREDLTPVILISIDTMRIDRLSGGGEPLPTSPHLDRLAREGVQWPDAVTPSPGSAASHAALLTSRYPVSNGVWANFSVMDDSVETLAERLRAMGYRTGGFVTNTFLGSRFGFAQGFDAYVESGVTERLLKPSGAALFRSLSVVQVIDRLRYRADPGHDPSFEAALTWLRESDRPPFLFLHFMDVHSPYVPPAPWDARFGAGKDGGPESPDHRNKFGWRPSIAAYTAEIAHLDSKIGRLRRELEALGLLDRAVIVVTTDHGENLVDHEPNFTHGSTMFESTLRVLALLRAPGRVAQGTLETRTLENVDFVPTVAGLLGWPPSDGWEGADLLGRNAPPSPRTTFGQLEQDFAVRTQERKVILSADGRRDVYSLLSDPGEKRPAAADSATAAAAEEALGRWLAETSTPLYTEQARSVSPSELSPETRDKLRALGYLD